VVSTNASLEFYDRLSLTLISTVPLPKIVVSTFGYSQSRLSMALGEHNLVLFTVTESYWQKRKECVAIRVSTFFSQKIIH
jgi:hypothetical protein